MTSKEGCLLPLPSRSTSMQGVAGLERLLPLVVAGASRGATQIEEVESTNVSQCSNHREHPPARHYEPQPAVRRVVDTRVWLLALTDGPTDDMGG